MKKKQYSKKTVGLLTAAAILLSCSSSKAADDNQRIISQTNYTGNYFNGRINSPLLPVQIQRANTIKIALLLDTSGSMDGLIEQAKSQLWKIVNQLALAKKGDAFAEIQIALYEYGNDGINQENGYVRQVVGLTDDLDILSMELFALRTNGGSEFCGQAISKSLTELDWAEETAGLQVMFIAGNEPFTQGRVNYEKACTDASKSDITVNTIFCGDMEEGIQTKWQHGAELTNGFYGSIQMNEATVYIETPFDNQIQELNEKLNATYLAFGVQGEFYRSNQVSQDLNSGVYGKSNEVERTITKSSHVYKNYTWDLVDAFELEEFDITTIEKDQLPVEMQEMSTEEKLAYVELKKAERLMIQKEIQELNVKRTAFIEQKRAENGDPKGGLDYAMIEAIKKQAIAKNFVF